MKYDKKIIYIIIPVFVVFVSFLFFFLQGKEEKEINKELETYKILSQKMIEGKLSAEELSVFSKKEEDLINLQKKGIEAIAMKDFLSAEKIFSELSVWNEKSSLPHIQLGWIYELKNDFLNAEREYKKAIELRGEEKLSVPYLGLARLYIQQEKYEEARMILEEGIKEDPAYPDFYKELGGVYEKLGDLNKRDEYTRKYQTVLKSPEEFSKPIESNVENTPDFYLGLAREALANKRAWEAEAMVKRGLEIDKNYAEFYEILRIVYEEYRMPDEARVYAEKYEALRSK